MQPCSVADQAIRLHANWTELHFTELHAALGFETRLQLTGPPPDSYMLNSSQMGPVGQWAGPSKGHKSWIGNKHPNSKVTFCWILTCIDVSFSSVIKWWRWMTWSRCNKIYLRKIQHRDACIQQWQRNQQQTTLFFSRNVLSVFSIILPQHQITNLP